MLLFFFSLCWPLVLNHGEGTKEHTGRMKNGIHLFSAEYLHSDTSEATFRENTDDAPNSFNHASHKKRTEATSTMTNGNQRRQEPEPPQGLALFDMNEIAVGRRLGSGGFCNVYDVRSFHPSVETDSELSEHQREARHTLARNAKRKKHKGQGYAVKFLQPELASNPKRFRIAARDIETEAALLSVINHPNIITIRGCAMASGSRDQNVDHDRSFLILDKLEGGTLNDKLEHWRGQMKRLNNPLFALLDTNGHKRKHCLVERLQVAIEIAAALEYLHEKRIVYRDLKSGNIGFDSSGKAVLFDFGLARVLPETSAEFNDTYKMSGKVGTFRYMAPEVATAKPYNESADVYSFSHILYQILALEKPYPDYSKHIHRMKVARGGERPDIDSRWPKTIQDLLSRSWSVNITDRPTMSKVVAILKDTVMELTGEKKLVCDTTTVCSNESLGHTVKSGITLKSVPSSPSSSGMPSVISFTDLQSQAIAQSSTL